MRTEPDCPTTDALRQAFEDADAPIAASVYAHLETCDECVRKATDLDTQDTLCLDLRVVSQSWGERSKGQELADQLKGLFGNRRNAFQAVDHIVARYCQPAQAPALGRIEHYELTRCLGAGGMGVVFEANDTKLQRRVALKFLHPRLQFDEEARRRFVAEARALAAIRCDAIVTVFDVIETTELPLLAMELLEGQTLEEHLEKRSRLTPAETVHVGKQVARGLAVTHAKGVLHRDIKPANIWLETVSPSQSDTPILFGPAYRVKLLDFGLAHWLAGENAGSDPGTFRGTPSYVSPEQAVGEALDERSDLFSLGCVLYRLCTGELPFPSRNALENLQSLAERSPPPVRERSPETPVRLARMIDQLLAKDPNQRPASAETVVGLFDALTDLEKPRGVRTNRVRNLALSLVGIAALVAAAIVIRIERKDGSVVTVEAPKDAVIRIGEEPLAANEATPAPAKDTTIVIGPPEKPPRSPMDLLKREDISPYELKVAGGGDPIKAAPELVAILGNSRFGLWNSHGRSPAMFHPDGKRILATDTGTVKIIDAQTGELLRSYRAGATSDHPCAVCSPDGKWIAFSKLSPLGYYTKLVLVNDSTQETKEIDQGDQITSLAFHPDGQSVISSGDNYIKAWSITPFAKKWTLAPFGLGAEPRSAPIYLEVRCRPDGKVLAVATKLGALRKSKPDLPKRNPVLILDAQTGAKLREIDVAADYLAWSYDGKRLACQGDWTVNVLNGETFAIEQSLPKFGKRIDEYNRPEFHPKNADLLVIAGRHNWRAGFHVWDLNKKSFVHADRIVGIHQFGQTPVFRPDGLVVAFQGKGGLFLYDTTTWKPLDGTSNLPRGDVEECAVTADGRFVYTGGSDGVLRRWDLLHLSNLPEIIDQLTDAIRIVRLAPDGKSMVFGNVWAQNFRLDLTQTPAKRSVAYPNAGFMDVSADTNTILISADRAVKVFDKDGKLVSHIAIPKDQAYQKIGLSTSGQKIFGIPNKRQKGNATLWNARTGAVLVQRDIGFDSIENLAFDGLDTTLAVSEGNIILFDANTLERKRSLGYHAGSNSARHAFHPNGKIIACVHGNGILAIYNTATGAKLHTLSLGTHAIFGSVNALFSADGRYLLTANSLGTVFIFRMPKLPDLP